MQNTQNTEELKDEIVLACQRLYHRSLVANHDGNVTVRLKDGRFLATPTSFSKGDVEKKDILILDHQGRVIDGPHKVFSEISWHLSIYRVRPDVTCVVHGHPPVSGGFGISDIELGVPALPEAIVSLGRHILTTRFISPLDSALGKMDGDFDLEIKRVLKESDAFLVPGNGAWAVGQGVLQTYYRLELVEHVACQHKSALDLGKLRRLPDLLIEDLLKRRSAAVPTNTVEGIHQKVPSAAVDKEKLAQIVRAELLNLLKE